MPRPTIHYMTESENRNYVKTQNEIRSKVDDRHVFNVQRIQETKWSELKKKELRLEMRGRQSPGVEDKDRIRDLVIRYLSEREYVSLSELVDRINAPEVRNEGLVRRSCMFRMF